jgi:chloride channel 7
VPSILCGAAYGRLVGVFLADLRPVTGSLSSIDEGTYALLGAASFLGERDQLTDPGFDLGVVLGHTHLGLLGCCGVPAAQSRQLVGVDCTYRCLRASAGGCMRMTVATCVMLLELTNNLALLPLMMLVTLVAKVGFEHTRCHP